MFYKTNLFDSDFPRTNLISPCYSGLSQVKLAFQISIDTHILSDVLNYLISDATEMMALQKLKIHFQYRILHIKKVKGELRLIAWRNSKVHV